jgi:ribosome maturation factor RimP
MSVTREKLIGLLEPEIEALGYELTDLELNLGHGNDLLRLFIDREAGIDLEDCEKVSHQVSGLLDVEDPIGAHYRLEVSSPGLDRKLVKPEHFDRFIGCEIKTRLKRLVDGRRRVRGQLVSREGEIVTVKAQDEVCSISLADIEVARLVPESEA